jgi:hypothetical protein
LDRERVNRHVENGYTALSKPVRVGAISPRVNSCRVYRERRIVLMLPQKKRQDLIKPMVPMKGVENRRAVISAVSPPALGVTLYATNLIKFLSSIFKMHRLLLAEQPGS